MTRTALSLAAVCILSLVPALAQEPAAPAAPAAPAETVAQQGFGFRVGWLRGDEIAGGHPGRTVLRGVADAPRLADSAVIGGFWFRDLSPRFRFEVALSVAPTEVENVCPDAEPGVTNSCAAHVDAVRTTLAFVDVRFMPHWQLGQRLHLGVPITAGWGYAWTSDDYAPAGFVVDQSLNQTFSGAGGATLSVGLRPWLELKPGRTAFLEARVLAFHRLVRIKEERARTIEVTAGMTFGKPAKAR